MHLVILNMTHYQGTAVMACKLQQQSILKDHRSVDEHLNTFYSLSQPQHDSRFDAYYAMLYTTGSMAKKN